MPVTGKSQLMSCFYNLFRDVLKCVYVVTWPSFFLELFYFLNYSLLSRLYESGPGGSLLLSEAGRGLLRQGANHSFAAGLSYRMSSRPGSAA